MVQTMSWTVQLDWGALRKKEFRIVITKKKMVAFIKKKNYLDHYLHKCTSCNSIQHLCDGPSLFGGGNEWWRLGHGQWSHCC